MGRKALVIGIDNYPNSALYGCINDAKEIASLLKNNEDDTRNFDVRLKLDIENKEDLSKEIKLLFDGDEEIALLYFSGHGTTKEDGEYLCTPDYTSNFPGVKLSDITTWISKSRCKNKIVILDSCFSGGMGNNPLMTECAELSKGTTFLAASKENHRFAR